MNDIMTVLKQGNILSQPEPHIKTGRWIYNVKGETLDGEHLNISVDIDDNKNILLTAFCKEG